MRNSLLSIGEAAKLKNVSIKALRYYEKLGIFNPAYIDPQSGYRYYSPAQLFDLDVILTCGELGIPLKHILDYQTEQGTIDLRQLLIEGSELAEQKMKRAHQYASSDQFIFRRDGATRQFSPLRQHLHTDNAFTLFLCQTLGY